MFLILFGLGMCSTSAAAITFTPFPDDPLGVNSTCPTGIFGNNVVGWYTASGTRHGFFFNGSAFTPLDDPLGVNGTVAFGISGNNIVGSYFDSSNLEHGFLYNGSTYTTLDDPLAGSGAWEGTNVHGISGNNIVGCYYDSSENAHAFLYNGSAYVPLNGTVALGISGNNIVGSYNNQAAFLYDGSTYKTFADPLGWATWPYGISGSGIVGSYFTVPDIPHGFLYDGTTYTALDDPLGSEGTFALGVYGSTVVGYYIDSSGEHGFSATVPEPSTFALLGVGAVGLFARVGGDGGGRSKMSSPKFTLSRGSARCPRLPAGSPAECDFSVPRSSLGHQLVVSRRVLTR
jgi:hypothetical protein